SAAEANTIAYNTFAGIYMSGVDATANTIRGNLIYSTIDDPTNTELFTGDPIADGYGIYISDGIANMIGGRTAGAGNKIYSNGGVGISVYNSGTSEDPALNNSILGNAIYSNGGLGIDIGD